MRSAVTVEVTFVGSGRLGPLIELPLAEGIVRLPDGTLRPFSGWIDLLGALEAVTVELGPAAGRSAANRAVNRTAVNRGEGAS